MPEVLILGEILAEIMRPEVGVPLSQPGAFLGPFPSGAPAIFIDTVSRLGHQAAIIGAVGKDDFGDCILNRLKEDGVDCTFINQSITKSTGVAFVTYFEDGSRKFIYHIGDSAASDFLLPEQNYYHNLKYFHIMGCSLMASRKFEENIVYLVNELKQKNVKISFDPNIRPELMKSSDNLRVIDEIMKYTNVLLPGREELLMISRTAKIEDAVEKCFENPVLEVIALKLGSHGCEVFTRDDKFKFGTYPVTVLDTTGAGDCFDGGFISALLEHRSYCDAIKIASAAATINTGAFGPMEGRISRETVNKLIDDNKMEAY